jgi:hypothetical protein
MGSQRRQLWVALVALGVGAAMLHFRIHPPSGGRTYLLANIFAFTDLILVSILFYSRKTAVWGLLLNSFLAFLGIILMADFSLNATIHNSIKITPQQNFLTWILQTTFPDISVAAADFFVGTALYSATMADQKKK